MSIEESIAAAVEQAAERILKEVAKNAKPLVVRREHAAKLLDCDPKHVDYLRDTGVLVPVRWPAREGQKRCTPYYSVADIEKAIEKYKGRVHD